MCVLFHGEPLKELANGVVPIPFGAEYSLRFRNKHNRRAVVKFFIDGENVSGNGYVIPANDYVDIKRHSGVDRAFKFVSLDSTEAVEFGKNGPNADKVKGTIEAHFYLERERPVYHHYDHHHHHYHDYYRPRPIPHPYPIWFNSCEDTTSCWNSGGTKESLAPSPTYTAPTGNPGASAASNYGIGGSSALRNKGVSSQSQGRGAGGAHMCNTSPQVAGVNLSVQSNLQDGCTVEGVSTGQYFSSTWIDTEDTATVLKIFLQGYDEHNVQVSEPKVRGRVKTNKEIRLDELESENEKLRKQLAEIENEKLKNELEKSKKGRRRKTTPKPKSK